MNAGRQKEEGILSKGDAARYLVEIIGSAIETDDHRHIAGRWVQEDIRKEIDALRGDFEESGDDETYDFIARKGETNDIKALIRWLNKIEAELRDMVEEDKVARTLTNLRNDVYDVLGSNIVRFSESLEIKELLELSAEECSKEEAIKKAMSLRGALQLASEHKMLLGANVSGLLATLGFAFMSIYTRSSETAPIYAELTSSQLLASVAATVAILILIIDLECWVCKTSNLREKTGRTLYEIEHSEKNQTIKAFNASIIEVLRGPTNRSLRKLLTVRQSLERELGRTRFDEARRDSRETLEALLDRATAIDEVDALTKTSEWSIDAMTRATRRGPVTIPVNGKFDVTFSRRGTTAPQADLSHQHTAQADRATRRIPNAQKVR